MEYQGSGRARLVDFYSGRSREDWHFLESPDYLRAVGALDESLPGKPSVIIPNYLTGMSNCLDPSDYHSVCCRDECEDLMADLKSRLVSRRLCQETSLISSQLWLRIRWTHPASCPRHS